MLILYGNAHSNYPLNSDGLSPLAFVLINLKDFELALKLCNDYKARLQSYEITILPSLFLQLVKRDNMDEMVTNRYLDIILNICGQCYIDLDGIKDEHRNNPLHFLIKNAGWSRKQSTKTFFLRLLKYLLPLKHNNWLQQKNKDDFVPTSLAFSLNALQIDTIQCLIDFDASIKQFCIDSHIDSIINSVLDLVTFSIQFMDQKNENSETDHYTSKLKAIFDIFINDNDLIQSKLISECLELKLIQQIQYLCKEDNQWQCRMDETQQQRLEILEEQQVGQKLLLPRQIREGIRQKRQEQKSAHDDHVYDDYKYDEQNKMSNKPKMIVMSSEDDMDLIKNMSVDSNDRIQTAKTIKLVNDGDANQQKQLDGNNKKRTNWIELVYGLTVESLSSLDLITDAIVLVELYRAKHVVWTTLMVFATICPYLVSYSVLITLFQKKSSNKNVSSFIRFLIGIFFMTPVCIIYFILIDVSFMFYVILSTLFFFISCGYIDIKDFIDDYIFKKLFNLSRMQIIGYRRLRTLSQLTFETIPQIFLQLRILQESQNEVTGVDTTNLMISIGIAIFHLIFEAIIISLDSRACYLSFYHYSIICLGARLKWIPYSNLFHSIHSISKNDSKKAQDPKQLKKQQIGAKMMAMKTYNYENIRSTTCGVVYNVDYIFTNESVRNLAEQLTVLPKITAEKWKMSKTLITKTENLWTIKLGSHCCKDIDLYSIADLFRACNGRINIDASTINWYELIFNNTDIRYLSYSPANLSAITKTFLECGDFDITTYLLDSRFGGHYNVNFVKAAMIRFGVLFALRKFYCGLVLFGLDKSSRNFIFYIMYYRLKTALSLNDKSYLKSAFMLLWYSSRAIFNDNTYLMDAEDKTECNVLFQFNEIQENEDDNDFEVQIDNVERGYDANEQGNVDFNFQVNAVEINSINSRKDSMQRFFAKTTKKYFENKKFQLVINDGNIESALQLSFRLAECFMCFHHQIELFLLTLFDDIIEQTNGNNINMRTKFKKDNNIYILTYNDYDNMDNAANDGEIKEIYNSAMGQSEEDDKYWHVSAQIMTQKHIDLLEYIVSTPAKSIRLSSEQYELMQEMDGLLRKKWKMFHQFNKYIHLMQDTYDRFRPQAVEIDTVHVRPNENRVIFDIPLPTTIGLETVRITFEDILINNEESDQQETTNNPDRIMGIIYLDISPLWTLRKQKGMIHPKHYDTVRWNKIILHKFTKQTLIRHKTPIIDLPANAEIFNFNPSVSDIALKMELSADAGEHIMCNTVKVALSYYVTLYEQPYHDEKYAYGYSKNALQRVATTVAPVMELDSNKSDDSRKCCVKSSTQMSDVQMEKALKQRVAQSKKEQRLTKTILLLGIANSGKQTWLKQMNTIYGEGFTDYDRKEEYEAMIHSAIRSNMVALINGIEQLSDHNNDMSNEEKDAMHYILQYNNVELVEEKKKDDSMDEIYANNIDILWKCNEIREVYNNRNVIAVVIDDSCAYFFDEIRRICRNQFVPSDKDILLVRNRSFDHEIRQISFDTRGTMFKLINPGNNRKIWVHSFNDKVTAMVYLASLSCYNEVSEQNNDENAMMESIQLFASVINRREFKSVAQLLFLNKKDVFAEKIQTVPLSVCFADYDGQDTFDESVSFIKERFDEQNQNPREKQIYTHVCCATDKSNVGRVFSDLSHIVVNQSLMRSGLT